MSRYGLNWNADEIALCEALWRTGGLFSGQIGKMVGRTASAVANKMSDLKVPRGVIPALACRGRLAVGARPWTTDEISILREHWGHTSAYQIGLLLNRNRNAVIGKAHRLHLGVLPPGRPTAIVYVPIVAIKPPPPAPEPLPIVHESSRPSWRCGCGGTCQPGRDHCARCISNRARPNPRASVWVGMRDVG